MTTRLLCAISFFILVLVLAACLAPPVGPLAIDQPQAAPRAGAEPTVTAVAALTPTSEKEEAASQGAATGSAPAPTTEATSSGEQPGDEDAGGTPTPEPTPKPIVLKVATAVAGHLSPAEVFEKVAPSVAFIKVNDVSGSGFLVDGGYLITNAHVVWPYDKARVVFPDGSEHEDVPVRNWDLLADLAVLGPLDTKQPSLTLADGENLPIGTEVYLIGYPGEVEDLPEPTLTRGVISRRREWEAAKLTYLQSDATIMGGQSGGVLVSNAGEVIGISGLGWPGAWEGLRFAMVASAVDLAPRISALTAGEDPSGLGKRRWQTDSGAPEQDFVLDNQRAARMFTLQAEPEAELKFELSGSGAFSTTAIDLWGQPLGGIDESTELTSTFSITVPKEQKEQPILLVVQSLSDSPIDVHVVSSADLFPQDDPDDGRVIGRSAAIFANMDYPGDIDYFELTLTAGDTVEVIADSMLVDPTLSVDYRGAPEEAIVQADETVGIYDEGDKLTFTAPRTGRYYVTVTSPMPFGYAVQVKEVAPDAEGTPAPSVAADELEATTTWYRSTTGPFRLRYPKEWKAQQAAPGVTAVFASEEGGALEIVERDMVSLGMGKLTQDEYVDQVIRRLETTAPGFKLISMKPFQAEGELEANVLVYSDLGGTRKCSSLLYLHEQWQAFAGTFCASPTRHRELEPLIQGLFRSFTVEATK
jgi:S1-C subfamily serine protease